MVTFQLTVNPIMTLTKLNGNTVFTPIKLFLQIQNMLNKQVLILKKRIIKIPKTAFTVRKMVYHLGTQGYFNTLYGFKQDESHVTVKIIALNSQ